MTGSSLPDGRLTREGATKKPLELGPFHHSAPDAKAYLLEEIGEIRLLEFRPLHHSTPAKEY